MNDLRNGAKFGRVGNERPCSAVFKDVRKLGRLELGAQHQEYGVGLQDAEERNDGFNGIVKE